MKYTSLFWNCLKFSYLNVEFISLNKLVFLFIIICLKGWCEPLFFIYIGNKFKNVMETKILTLQITPVRRLNFNNDFGGDDNLIQEGLYVDEIDVESGEDFIISKGFEGRFIDDDSQYKVIHWTYDGRKELEYSNDFPVLVSGRYKFNDDGITIEQLSVL